MVTLSIARRIALALVVVSGVVLAQGQTGNWTPQDKAAGNIPVPQDVEYEGTYPDVNSFFKDQSNSFTDGCYIPHDPNTWTQPTFINNGSGGTSDDDGSNGPIALPFTFDFFGQSFNEMWININGNISFDGPYWQYSPTGFPSSDYVMLAPFWGDVDLGGTGEVWYNVTPDAVYINWVGVGYFSDETDLVNTFQLIITDGTNPLIGLGNNVAFYYDDMQWTTGSASGGSGGFGGSPATVGANVGNGTDFFLIGRFDHPGTDYDGPNGDTDGVDYLDGQCIQFSVSEDENFPPVAQNFPANNTVNLCVGETMNLSVNFTGPENDQAVSVVVDAGSYSGFNATSNVPGNPAVVSFTLEGTAPGSYNVAFTASDDHVPAGVTTVNLTVNVISCYEENPDLTGDNCPSIDVILILDESNSIGNDDDEVVDGAVALANGLKNTTARLAVIKFSTSAENVDVPGFGAGYVAVDDAYVASLQSHLNSTYNPNGWTNWEDALEHAKTLHDADAADLIVIVTDGNPTAMINDGGCTGCGNSNGSACYDCNESNALARAEAVANLLKGSGAHLFALGVADNIDAANLAAITGPDQDLGPGDQPGIDPPFNEADYTLLPFEELEECLALIANSLCCTADPTVECLPNVEVECNTPFDPSVTGIPQILGNTCGLEYTLDYADELTVQDACNTYYVRTWYLYNAQGEIVDDCNHVIHIYDTQAPTLIYPDNLYYTFEWGILGSNLIDDFLEGTITEQELLALAPILLPELQAQGFFFPYGEDNCDPEPDINFSQTFLGSENFDCPLVGQIIWTFNAEDECENQSVSIDVICDFFDTTPPVVLTELEDITLTCNDEIPSMDDVQILAEDACSDNVYITPKLTPLQLPYQECTGFRTQTPGGWGSPANGDNPGTYRDAHFSDAFPGGLVVGCDYTLTLTSAAAVEAFLPSGGMPAALTGNLVDPVGYGNTLAGHVVAAKLSLGFDANDPNFSSNALPLANLIYNNGPFMGWTVAEVLAEAEKVLGGCDSDYSASFLTEAVATFNENYVDGTTDHGNFSCGEEEQPDCVTEILQCWLISDDCGNTATVGRIIYITDNEAPVFGDFDPYISVECDELENLEAPEATDDCGSITITYEDMNMSGGCLGVLVRTWIATDDCGNSSEVTQYITVTDTTAPVIYGVGDDMTVECDEPIQMPMVWAEDNCGQDVMLEFSESTVPGECPQSYTIIWTWTATDYCDNVSVAQKTITVVDTTAPELSGVPQEMTLSCEMEVPAPAEVTATDNCGMVTIVLEESIVDGECTQEYTLIRTWTATDECGNSASQSQMIHVVDNNNPFFTYVPDDVTVQCDEALPTENAMADDLCGQVDVWYEDEVIPTDCASEYSIYRTYYAEDECGNMGMAFSTITVEDTTAPVLSDLPADIELDCEDELPAAPLITATDNCDVEVEVEFTEEFFGDFPNPDAEEDCVLLQPISPYYNPDWAVWLQQFPGGYELYEVTSGEWLAFADGSATINATVVSIDNPNGGWNLSIALENGMGWDDWSTQGFSTYYKDDFNLAGDEYLNWMYYIINGSSTMTGWGDFAGSSLSIVHAPSNQYYGYQVGVAANNVNGEYGSGGWFTYSGTFMDASQQMEIETSGAGDFAFNHDCCPQYEVVWTWTATDCAGNMTSHSTTISFNGDPQPFAGEQFATCAGDFNQDHHINTVDLLMILSEFGCDHNNCGCDLTMDEKTNTPDLLTFLSAFGGECE